MNLSRAETLFDSTIAVLFGLVGAMSVLSGIAWAFNLVLVRLDTGRWHIDDSLGSILKADWHFQSPIVQSIVDALLQTPFFVIGTLIGLLLLRSARQRWIRAGLPKEPG